MQDKFHYSVTIAEAFEVVFGLKLTDFDQIRAALNSLLKSNVIKNKKTPIGGGSGSRNRIYIRDGQLDLIWNVVILQGLFSDTKVITSILTDTAERAKMAEFAHVILIGRQSLVGVALMPLQVDQFLSQLTSDCDLRTQRLPNPFECLPQLVLAKGTSMMPALLAQSSSLTTGDAMMVHYLNDEIEQAWKASQSISSDDTKLMRFKHLIEKEYREAVEFDDLLDLLQ